MALVWRAFRITHGAQAGWRFSNLTSRWLFRRVRDCGNREHRRQHGVLPTNGLTLPH